MSYQVLSLKWRPQTFDDVAGQDHVTQTVKNAFKKDRVAQGYIFTGLRGVGKTTMARILAKSLNCQNPIDFEPCNECSNCHEITDSRNMDVLEIDGASNRGIDEIRNIRENIKFPPMNAPYKVYIIDEVHMLTTPAFNALLRTLEEPPPHGKFIMCTTDIHKMPATIISRCQRYDFNLISSKVISDRLKYILEEEKITFDNESLTAISNKAGGSMRDALSLLDQVIAFSGEKIVFDQISTILGLIPYEMFFNLTSAIKEKNGENLVLVLNKIRELGTPLEDVVNGLNQHMRNLLIGSVEGAENALEVNPDLQEMYISEAGEWDRRDVLRIAQTFSKLEPEIRRAAQPQIMLEMTLLKTLEMDSSVSIENMLSGKTPIPNPPLVHYKSPEVSVPKESAISSQNNVEKPMVKEPVDLPPKEEKVLKKETEKKESAPKLADKTAKIRDAEKKAEPPKNNELDLEYIQANWHQIVTEVGKIKTSISIVLEHTYPEILDNKKLTISVMDQPRFSLDRLGRNKNLVESKFEEIFGQSIRMAFVVKSEEEVKENKTEPSPIKHKPSNGEPVIDRVIELFDGEIIR